MKPSEKGPRITIEILTDLYPVDGVYISHAVHDDPPHFREGFVRPHHRDGVALNKDVT